MEDQYGISLDPGDPRIPHFASRFRHVVVADMPKTDDPWQREIWQRNAVLRGLPDAAPDDRNVQAKEAAITWTVAARRWRLNVSLHAAVNLVRGRGA